MNLFEAGKLARSLMAEHGLNHWCFAWSRAKKQLGLCDFIKETIYLSKILTPHREEKNVRNTILHEIAHALVGYGHGHNRVWRRKCIEIGGDGKRCESDISSSQVVTPKYLIINTLNNSLVQIYHRRPSKKVYQNIHLYFVKGKRGTKGYLVIEKFNRQKHQHLIQK